MRRLSGIIPGVQCNNKSPCKREAGESVRKEDVMTEEERGWRERREIEGEWESQIWRCCTAGLEEWGRAHGPSSAGSLQILEKARKWVLPRSSKRNTAPLRHWFYPHETDFQLLTQNCKIKQLWGVLIICFACILYLCCSKPWILRSFVTAAIETNRCAKAFILFSHKRCFFFSFFAKYFIWSIMNSGLGQYSTLYMWELRHRIKKWLSPVIKQLLGVTVSTCTQACYSIPPSDTCAGTDKRRLYAEQTLQPDCRTQRLAWPLTGCAILSKLINLSVPLLSHPQMRIITIPTSEGHCRNKINSYVLSTWHQNDFKTSEYPQYH